jgi:hypothetical protein
MSRHAQTGSHSHERDSSMMQSWQNKHLTEVQRETLRCEYEHLRSFLANLPERAVLVDVGCGDARVLVNVELGGRRYIGVDIDRDSVEAAREMCEGLVGAHILEPQDYREALRELQPGGPIAALCLGGTLGSFPGDEREHLKALTEKAHAFFFTVWHKSPQVIDQRIEYYIQNRLDFAVKWHEGSTRWGEVRSWTQEELGALCREELSEFACHIVETPPLAWTVMGYRKE